jgi:hypothetical protein
MIIAYHPDHEPDGDRPDLIALAAANFARAKEAEKAAANSLTNTADRFGDIGAPADSPTSGTPMAYEWTELIPLEQPSVPAFPRDALPGWLGEHAEAVSLATETPLELAALLDLAAIATCCAKRFVVSPQQGYVEPLNIFVAPAMESGNRKTAVLTESTRALIDWERERAAEMAPEIARIASQRKTQEKRIEKLRLLAASPKYEMNMFQPEIEKLEASLPIVPVAPKLWAADATPEQLAALAYQQGERIAILSDEGGIFDLLAGRYNAGVPNLDLVLQAHAGSAVRVDRTSRPPIVLDSPALTIGLSPQPEVLQGLAGKPGFRGRGLLARFAFALPVSRIGSRDLIARPVPPQVQATYAAGIRELLAVKPKFESNGKPIVDVFGLTRAALGRWKEFQRAVEVMMREGGQLAHLRDWGGKLPGFTLRVAGLLHCVVETHAPEKKPIEETTMVSALKIGTVLIPHALAVFDLMGADPLLSDARAVARWLKRKGATEFSARDCFCAMQTRFKRMDKLRLVLALLVDHCYIREMALVKGAHRPSERFLVNPKALGEQA